MCFWGCLATGAKSIVATEVPVLTYLSRAAGSNLAASLTKTTCCLRSRRTEDCNHPISAQPPFVGTEECGVSALNRNR